MKLFLTFIALSLFFSFEAQTTGYFGKKNLLELGITIQNPLLYNFYGSSNSMNKPYHSKNGTLEPGSTKINYGFRLSYGKMLKRNLAVYLESGLNYFSVIPDSYYSGNQPAGQKYMYTEGEMLDIRTFSILPKIELTSDDGLLPIGVTNQFGFGVNFYKTLDKEYVGYADSMDAVYGFPIPVNITRNNYYDYSNQAIKGYTFLYKLTMRIPINDRLLYHFGFRYTCNFVPLSNYSMTSEHVLTQANMWESIRHKETRNLINFETGISFAF